MCGARSLLTAFGQTPSLLRAMWLGYLAGAMTRGVSRTYGVSISVRVRATNCLYSTELLTDIILHIRDDAADTSRDAGRSFTTMSRSLGDSCRPQDRRNRWGRERIAL